jgi:DNA-binding LacI/PurR family transcriptional regulator
LDASGIDKARLATQHLIDLGHREIAEISGPLLNYDGCDRHEAWIATLEDNGIEPGPSVDGGFTIDGGYAAMCQLLESGAKFTAVVIGNDSMAFGAHTALRERGLSVPDHVSVVGFDDLPESAHFVPALTTICQDFAVLGQLAIEYLISKIENPQPPVHQRVLLPKLITAESTRAI